MLQRFEDLRFVIGLFFAIISVLLVFIGFVDGGTTGNDARLNLQVGVAMAAFAIAMLVISTRDAQNEA